MVFREWEEVIKKISGGLLNEMNIDNSQIIKWLTNDVKKIINEPTNREKLFSNYQVIYLTELMTSIHDKIQNTSDRRFCHNGFFVEMNNPVIVG